MWGVVSERYITKSVRVFVMISTNAGVFAK
jgi:hypothetical protein